MLLSDVNPDESQETIEKNNITLSNFDLTNTKDGVEWIDFSELTNEDQKSNYKEIVEDEESDDDTFHVEEDIWQEVHNWKNLQRLILNNFQVDRVVSNIPLSKEPYLHHVGETFLVIKRKDDNSDAEVKNYQGLNQTDLFSQQLLFSPSMFDDHMPEGYDHIFKGLPNSKDINYIIYLQTLDL